MSRLSTHTHSDSFGVGSIDRKRSTTLSQDETHTRINYMKIINEEFQSLQSDPEMKNKSLFDMIDYCELIYEDLTRLKNPDTRLRVFVKGYLIFSYFINSLIMMHFSGFDEFIKANEQDFILYLHLYNFYNGVDSYASPTFAIPLNKIKAWIAEYLESHDLLQFDIEELYDWLDDYIDYLKEKDAYEEEEHEIAKRVDVGNSISKSQDSHNLHNEMLKGYKAHGDHLNAQGSLAISEADSNGRIVNPESDSSDDGSIKDFIDRFPSVRITRLEKSDDNLRQAQKNLLQKVQIQGKKEQQHHQNHIPTKRPPVPSTAPPNLPILNKSFSYDTSALPYPIDNVKDKSVLPYPIDIDDEVQLLNSGYKKDDSRVFHHSSTSPSLSHPRLLNTNEHPRSESLETNNRPIHYKAQKSPSRYEIKDTSSPAYSSRIRTSNQNSNYDNSQISNVKRDFVNGQGHHHLENGNTQLHADSQRKRLELMRAFLICGLRNLGSSCYINLTIQLLFGLQDFKEIFFERKYRKFVEGLKSRALIENLEGRNPLLMSEAISGLLQSFRSHGGAAIAPTKFLRICNRLKPEFNIPNEQQDSQEFLLFLLERLHEELCHEVKQILPYEIEDYMTKWHINVTNNDKKEYQKWYESLVKSEGTSPVNDLFQGHLQSKLICRKCRYESITYSPFTILSLPIPGNHTNKVDLSDCLKYYIQDEILTGDNAWNCPKCNNDTSESEAPSSLDNHPVFTQKRGGLFSLGRRSKSPYKGKPKKTTRVEMSNLENSVSIKSLNFIKMPQVLFVHLARFSMFNLTDKLNTIIKYPLVLKFNNHSSGHEISYKMIGIVNHYGNLKSGHYTALVNKSTSSNNFDDMIYPCWCYFDDDSVRVNLNFSNINGIMSYEEHSSRDVYLLCYERI